ncbi:MAG TPA: hypothetical protein V6D33_19395 [Cyanophyceae cyanobacterium]
MAMLKIPKPNYDVVLRFYPYRIEVAFAANISPEIEKDLLALNSDAIAVKREVGSFSPPGCHGILMGSGGDEIYRKKQDAQALEFNIQFLPVWEPSVLAEAIARGLEAEHNLRVRVIDDSPPESREKIKSPIL